MAKERKRQPCITINGIKYINTRLFSDEFLYDDTHQIDKCREDGMPYIKFNGYYYYNVDDCHKWYAGNYKGA